MRIIRIFAILIIAPLALAACAGGPSFTDTTEPKDPTGFMNYSEQLGRATDGFNPCNHGIDESDTDFSAETATAASRRDGLDVDQRTYTRKSGNCN